MYLIIIAITVCFSVEYFKGHTENNNNYNNKNVVHSYINMSAKHRVQDRKKGDEKMLCMKTASVSRHYGQDK